MYDIEYTCTVYTVLYTCIKTIAILLIIQRPMLFTMNYYARYLWYAISGFYVTRQDSTRTQLDDHHKLNSYLGDCEQLYYLNSSIFVNNRQTEY